jgi:hypothetical protein
MRRTLMYSILLFSITFSAKAQSWNPVSMGITGKAANTTWSLFAYDSMLYAGGWFTDAGGVSVNDMAQWNSTNWASTGTGSSGFISAMALYNGDLYAAGKFDTIGGVLANRIAMWNGSNWSPLGKGIKALQYGVYALTTYNGLLYAGGSFDSAGGKPIYGIAQWDGSNWSSLSTGIYARDEEDGVFALAVYNGELYVAGGFDSAGGVPVSEIAKWDGTKWFDIGKYTNAVIYSLAVYNGNLYAGGLFDTIGGIPAHRIAMWNGTVWSALDSGITGEAGWANVNALASYNGDLYVGGTFDTVNGKHMNCIAKWNGTNWSPVGSGINVGGSIDAMAVYKGSLYVGGGFDSAGGIYAKNIAMWTSPSTLNELSVSNDISAYPNPANKYLIVKINGQYNDATYDIYNMFGQRTITGNLYSNVNILNIEYLPEGIYMLKMSIKDEQYNYKFIKE